jgi:hypothetical protein
VRLHRVLRCGSISSEKAFGGSRSGHEFVEAAKVLRFFSRIVVSRIWRAEVRQFFVFVGHYYSQLLVNGSELFLKLIDKPAQ